MTKKWNIFSKFYSGGLNKNRKIIEQDINL